MADTRTTGKVRVLWLSKGLGPGGMERLLVNHARFADHDAFSYQAAYLRPDKLHLVATLAALRVPAQCLHSPVPHDLRWAGRLRRLLVDEQIDIIHVHSPAVATVARLIARTVRPRPRFVYTEHNVWSSYDLVTRLANLATYPLDDAHQAVSEQVRESVPARLQRRLTTVIHGIDVDAVRAELAQRDVVRSELGFAPDDVVIGIVANLRSEKGYPDLFAAARAVIDRCPNVKFVGVGQGPLEAELNAEHARLELGDRFRILGYREDSTRVMSAFDIFTLASHFEGLPVTLMEARALGIPVVVTRVGGLTAHVRDGVDGVLVEPGQPAALADALAALAIDDDRRARLAIGSEAAASAFDARSFTRTIEDTYRRVTANPARR